MPDAVYSEADAEELELELNFLMNGTCVPGHDCLLPAGLYPPPRDGLVAEM